jgi:hypothetical protein
MVRFKRSDYDSVLSEDSPYTPRLTDKPTPLFTDKDTGSLVMWSGKLKNIPEVGDKIKSRTPVEYEGVVKEHFLEAGFVGLKVLPYPQYHEALSKQSYGHLPKEGEPWTTVDLVWNYGVDLQA